MEFLRRHLFWIGILLALAASAGLYQFGVSPLRVDNSEEAAKLDENERRLVELEAKKAKLPGEELIRVHQEHKQWLTSEYAKCLEILREKDRPLESQPISSKHNAPAEFKAAYKDRADDLRKRMSRIAVGDVLPAYRWETAGDLPSPAEYEAVEKCLVIIESLWQEMRSDVRKIERMALEKRPGKKAGRDALAYDIVGVDLRVQIEEKQVIPFVERILKPKSNIPVLLRSLGVQKVPKAEWGAASGRAQAPPVRVTLNLEVLDLSLPAS